jgi:hypothetical protein
VQRYRRWCLAGLAVPRFRLLDRLFQLPVQPCSSFLHDCVSPFRWICDLDLAPFGVVFQALIRDFIGPVRVVQNVSNEAHGLFLAGFELSAGEGLQFSDCYSPQSLGKSKESKRDFLTLNYRSRACAVLRWGGSRERRKRAIRSLSVGSAVNRCRCCCFSCRANSVISLRISRGSAGPTRWRFRLCAAGLCCRSTFAAWI